MADKPKQHPDGLPFPPVGEGWTTNNELPVANQRTFLLTSKNIEAIRKHNEDRWEELSAELTLKVPPSKIDRKTGRMTSSLSDDERQRLLALALFVDKGVVREVFAT